MVPAQPVGESGLDDHDPSRKRRRTEDEGERAEVGAQEHLGNSCLKDIKIQLTKATEAGIKSQLTSSELLTVKVRCVFVITGCC